jgi:hypothetical protein
MTADNPFDDTPPGLPNVQQAVNAAMNQVLKVGKGGKYSAAGTHYNFRGVDQVVNAAGPAFRQHGIIFAPHKVKSVSYTFGQARSGGQVQLVKLVQQYRVYGPAGDWFPVEVAAEATDSADKGTAKAESVAYRTALLQVLAIPTGDPDPDSFHHELGPAPQQYGAAGPQQEQVSAANVLEEIALIQEKICKAANITSDLMKEQTGQYLTEKLHVADSWNEAEREVRWDKVRPGQRVAVLTALRDRYRQMVGSEQL